MLPIPMYACACVHVCMCVPRACMCARKHADMRMQPAKSVFSWMCVHGSTAILSVRPCVCRLPGSCSPFWRPILISWTNILVAGLMIKISGQPPTVPVHTGARCQFCSGSHFLGGGHHHRCRGSGTVFRAHPCVPACACFVWVCAHVRVCKQ